MTCYPVQTCHDPCCCMCPSSHGTVWRQFILPAATAAHVPIFGLVSFLFPRGGCWFHPTAPESLHREHVQLPKHAFFCKSGHQFPPSAMLSTGAAALLCALAITPPRHVHALEALYEMEHWKRRCRILLISIILPRTLVSVRVALCKARSKYESSLAPRAQGTRRTHPSTQLLPTTYYLRTYYVSTSNSSLMPGTCYHYSPWEWRGLGSGWTLPQPQSCQATAEPHPLDSTGQHHEFRPVSSTMYPYGLVPRPDICTQAPWYDVQGMDVSGIVPWMRPCPRLLA